MLSGAPVTMIMLIANVTIGLYSLFVNPDLIDKWAFKPIAVKRGEWGRFLTAGFVHVGLAHLLFNMVTLFAFGPYIETQLGLWRFFVLYIGSEITANALTYWRHRNNASYSAVGASGAIAGIVFSFCLFEPLEKIYILFLPFGIPAVLFGVLYLLGSSYAAAQGRGRVAHEAHIGGALGGIVLTLILAPYSGPLFLSQLGF